MVPASGKIPFRVAVSGREGASCADVTVRVLMTGSDRGRRHRDRLHRHGHRRIRRPPADLRD